MAKTEVKVAQAPKGTQKSEAILGTAVVKLNNGLKSFYEMVAEVNTLGSKVEDNLLVISDQETKIAEQALELKNTIAQNKIELAQAYERNQESFVNEWLVLNDKVAIDGTELDKLRVELANAIKGNDDEAKKQVAIVSNSMKSAHEAAIREKELTFKAQEAENRAQLSQKDEKIKFLEQQVEHWREALSDERDASVARAQASSINQTITSGK